MRSRFMSFPVAFRSVHPNSERLFAVSWHDKRYMNIHRLALTGALFTATLFGQTASETKDSKVFDPNAIDRSADPCTDFYQYSCGTWLKNNPIPSDQASWGRFSELNERNRVILRDILETATAAKTRDANTQKIGDYYSSCLDEKTIEAKGLSTLKTEFARIDAMKSSQDMAEVLAYLHQLGVNVLFNISSGQDFKDSTAVIGNADQGGLGLPEKDFYFAMTNELLQREKSISRTLRVY